jgi:hypothetical protein
MKCDKCQNEFESEQLMQQNELVTRNKVNLYPALDLGELIKFYKSLKVSAFLCEKCFWSDYKKFAISRSLIVSIFFIIANLFGFSLIAFGKWDSPTQQFWAGVILFSVLNGGWMGILLIYFLIFKRKIKPYQADQTAIFAPYLFDKLKDRKQELETVEKILGIYQKNPNGFSRTFGGQSVEELREIGHRLYHTGGIELMRRVHEDFSKRCDFLGAPRNLEHIWDGVGTWKG